MKKLNIALLNDSFYPCIDGVANVVMNYARELSKYSAPVVFTPKYPGANSPYPFDIVRYESINVAPRTGYRVGIPFAKSVQKACNVYDFDVIHSHCPVISGYLARYMRRRYHAPSILTYHTKYDVDIDYCVSSEEVRRHLKSLLLRNINAFDEVWVVSEGAGKSLQNIGYQGQYTVMRNGVDIPRKRAEDGRILALRRQWSIAPGIPVFLFVGRMMWYKGIRQILDGMQKAKQAGCAFKTIFVGDGTDKAEVQQYAQVLGLSGEAVFAGKIVDRDLLATYYSLALLLLFPSEYDTNGLVVREAAACSLPCVLLQGSCAAEGVVHNRNGILISPASEDIAKTIAYACNFPHEIRRIGETAAREIYIPWNVTVETAYLRYRNVIMTGQLKK